MAVLHFGEQPVEVTISAPVMMIEGQTPEGSEEKDYALPVYAAILCIVQVALIVLIWLSVSG